MDAKKEEKKEEPLVGCGSLPISEVVPQEPSAEQLQADMKQKQIELNEMRDKLKEEHLKTLQIDIIEHKHCVSCGRPIPLKITQCHVCSPPKDNLPRF